MVLIQRASANGGNLSTIPRSNLTFNSNFTSSSRDIWLNSLWFTSLALTLVTALAAGFIKQWLNYYSADITGSSPKVRAITRQYRYRGLMIWGVPPIIEALPILMNTSLFLFFVGLVLYTRDLSGTTDTMWTLVAVTLASFTAYVLSSLFPLWNPQCQYKTSLTKVFSGALKLIWLLVRK